MISNEDLNTFNQDVVRLCEATTELHGEIAGQKARFENKLQQTTANAAEAKQHSSSANDSRNSAMNAEIGANSHATRAEAFAQRAEQVSGLSEVAQAVQLAMNDASVFAMSKSEFQAQAESNKSVYLGSGFLESGKHYATPSEPNSINGGLQGWTPQYSIKNALAWGRSPFSNSHAGSSKTYFPVALVDGVKLDLSSIGSVNYSEIRFPPAPDGTRVYDSYSGALIDYKRDVDPKYGNIAEDHSEAVARAFEGLVCNGDGRMGDEYWSVAPTTGNAPPTLSVVDGKMHITLPESGEGNSSLRPTFVGIPSTGYVKVRFCCDQKPTGYKTYLFHGDGSYSAQDIELGWNEVIVPRNGDEQFLISWQGSTRDGSKGIFHSVSAMSPNQEVVLNRQDFAYLEMWHEDITEKDIVCPNGSVQYAGMSFLGMNTRNLSEFGIAQTYSAFGVWDDETMGRGFKWSSLTPSQQKTFIDHPQNNIYFDHANGKLIQVRYRLRSDEGCGKPWDMDVIRTVRAGYWRIKPGSGASSELAACMVQGKGLTPRNKSYFESYLTYKNDLNTSAGRLGISLPVGTCDSHNSTRGSSENQIPVAIPICIVQRLNQGAYHPELNPLGCGRQIRDTLDGWVKWYANNAVNPRKAADCFIDHSVGGIAGLDTTGSIGAQYGSGRPDGMFSDAIHATLVQDCRLDARPQDITRLREELANKVMSGTVRGKQRLMYTWTGKITIVTSPVYSDGYTKFVGASTTSQIPRMGSASNYTPGLDGKYSAYVRSPIDGGWYKLSYFFTDDKESGTTYLDKSHGNSVSKFVVNESTELDVIISADDVIDAEFDVLPWVDIVATPERIKEEFPNGVIGQWVNATPNGAVQSISLNKKVNSGSVSVTRKLSSGSNWEQATYAVDEESNSFQSEFGDGYLLMLHYMASSVFTETSINSELIGGVGNVAVTHRSPESYGNRMMQSLTGAIAKSNPNTGSLCFNVPMVKVDMETTYNRLNKYRPSEHAPISMAEPVNNSEAIKCLISITERNGLLHVLFNGCSLKYNGESWGDDNVIPVVNGEGTKTDLNGNDVMTFCHRSIYPIGINNGESA